MRIPNRPLFAIGAVVFTISTLIYREAVISAASGLCVMLPPFYYCSTINLPLYLAVAVIGLLIVGASFFLFRHQSINLAGIQGR